MNAVDVVDSHTEGEPTRVVIAGAPDLGPGTVATQARVFRERFDWFRSAVVNEPRGFDALVGALIVPAADPVATCGVIFFNNVGLLNACGHGTIGLAATLVHLGRAAPGATLAFETPVGLVHATPHRDGHVEIRNVPSRRCRKDARVSFEFEGRRVDAAGDIAWGGNWFFLIKDHGLDLSLANLDRLTAYAWAARRALEAAGITGDDGGVIDHVELFGPPSRDDCDSRNFVLCPGKAYDRSPCGTGTSAKMACLHADGLLPPGSPWRQESIIGSRFVGTIVGVEQGSILPSIRGSTFVTSRATLHLDPRDPFRHGIRA
jgi:4-hydroxyproline epimerase